MNNTRLRVSVNFRDTELAVLQNSVPVWHCQYSVGAVDWILELMLHLRFERDLLIGRPTAERILLIVGAVVPLEPIQVLEVKGRNLKTGFPTGIEVSSEEVREIMRDAKELTWQIAHSLRTQPSREGVIMRPPVVPLEFRPALRQHPIELTGEFGRIRGLDQRITEATGLDVIAVDKTK